MVSALPLEEIQIAHAAEDMIRKHGDEALTKVDDWILKLNYNSKPVVVRQHYDGLFVGQPID